MWTQVAHSKIYNPASIGGNYIDIYPLGGTGSTTIDLEKCWVVISAKSLICEIRKIVSSVTSGGITTLTFASGIELKCDHPVDAVVYIQTSPIWDISLFDADPAHEASTNTTAINNAAYDCNYMGGGIVWIPKGEFMINHEPIDELRRHDSGAPPYNGCIDVRGKNNIKFMGEGIGISILKIEEGFYGLEKVYVFNATSVNIDDFRNTLYLEWHDMTLDGNRYEVEAHEQSHAISLSGSVSGGTIYYSENTIVNNVAFVNTIADGVKVGIFKNIVIKACRFLSCGRSGVTVQTSLSKAIIDSNYFENTNDQDIDSEPSGNEYSTSPNKIIISNNHIVKKKCNYTAITLNGFRASGTDDNIIVRGNIIEGGGIYSNRCRNVVITDNTIISGSGKWAFWSLSLLENLVFSNNILTNNTLKLEAVYVGFDIYQVAPRIGLGAKNIIVSGNIVENGGLLFDCVQELSITDNTLNLDGRKTALGIRIRLQEDLSVFDIPHGPDDVRIGFGGLTIIGNTIQQTGYAGVWLSSNKADDPDEQDYYRNICIDNNNIAGKYLQYGVYFMQKNKHVFWDKLLVGSTNIIHSELANPKTVEVFHDYQTGDNPYEENWITTKIPEGVLDAPQGAMAVYNGIAGDNKYQKNSLKGDINGWMLVSELDRQLLFLDTFLNTTTSNINLPSHTPDFNIFTGGLWTVPTGQGHWSALPNSVNEARPTGNLSNLPYNSSHFAIALINSSVDCEIKAIFRNTGEISSNTSVDYATGIVFRNNTSTSSYFYFYFKNLPSGLYEMGVVKVVGSSSTILFNQYVDLSPTMLINLKVMLQGDFISVFYNDLLLWTVLDSTNNTSTQHGMINFGYYITSGLTVIPKYSFLTQCFKILTH